MPTLTPASAAARFNEFAFRRYEPVIAAVVRNFPRDTIVSFDSLSPETFIHRLRDAARGYNTFRYPSDISYPKFLEVWPQVEVQHTTLHGEPHCRIGPPKNIAALAGVLAGAPTPAEIVYPCPNRDCLIAFLTLSTYSTFPAPIRLRSVPPDLHHYLRSQAYLTDYPQATVEPHGETDFILF